MAEPNGTARASVWISAGILGVATISAGFGLFWTANAAYTKTLDLESRLTRAEITVRESRTEISVLCAKLTEVETQFRASDQVRNLMHANELRVEAMLWRKSFGSDYPTSNAYYPTIAQEQPAACRGS